ncbi:ion channel [Desulfomicrobium macestii]|nr:ion channel [Desulfomicrobium macestii]
MFFWGILSLILAFAFGILYYSIGGSNFNTAFLKGNDGNPGFWALQYYSIVTFTTLGFGDIVPKTGVAAFLVTLEVITGYIMLGGLIAIFANRLAKRND